MWLFWPGTGLEKLVFWDGQYLRPFATEGGHSEFSPRNNLEVEFYQYLKTNLWYCKLGNGNFILWIIQYL